MTNQTVTVNTPQGQQQIPNPLYAFTKMNPHSQSDFSGIGGGDWDAWPNTLRYPSSSTDANAQSNEAGAVQAIGNYNAQARAQVYRVLTACPNFLDMSNDGVAEQTSSCGVSLESIHNGIHTFTGGQNQPGHMSYNNFAAFDPAFFLHHANVDRLFALWQSLNPNNYMPSASQGNTDTFTINANAQVDANTPLEPFHGSGGQAYTCNSVRDVTSFRYTYPELQAGNVAQAVNSLYGSNAVPQRLSSSSSSPSSTATSNSASRSGASSGSNSASATGTAAGTSGTSGRGSSGASGSGASQTGSGGSSGRPGQTSSGQSNNGGSASSIFSGRSTNGGSTNTAAGASGTNTASSGAGGSGNSGSVGASGTAGGAGGAGPSASGSAGSSGSGSSGSGSGTGGSAGNGGSAGGQIGGAGSVIGGQQVSGGATTAPTPGLFTSTAIAGAGAGGAGGATGGPTASAPFPQGTGGFPQVGGSNSTNSSNSNLPGLLTPTGRTHDYTCHIVSEKHGLGGTYTVFGFLTNNSIPDNADQWLTHPDFCGAHSIFAPLGQDSKTGMLVGGTISLTTSLVGKVANGEIPSIEENDVLPYLQNNLQWKVATAAGAVVPNNQVPGLTVGAVSQKVMPAANQGSLPTYGNGNTNNDVTHGKSGGIQSGMQYNWWDVCGAAPAQSSQSASSY